MFLLDTNVISESRKLGTPKGEPSVARWLVGVDFESLYLSTITLFELEAGIVRMERRDAPQGRNLRRWYERAVLAKFERRILDFDTAAASVTAALHTTPTPPLIDSMIAGIALSRGLTVVTRNVRDFEPTGVRLVNPWASTG